MRSDAFCGAASRSRSVLSLLRRAARISAASGLSRHVRAERNGHRRSFDCSSARRGPAVERGRAALLHELQEFDACSGGCGARHRAARDRIRSADRRHDRAFDGRRSCVRRGRRRVFPRLDLPRLRQAFRKANRRAARRGAHCRERAKTRSARFCALEVREARRAGWHIECSAMAHELLGEPFDIHGGGTDLIFPHHENEIAQSESLLPRPPMANFWVHGGMLNFEQRKMSKSLGNYEPLSELLARSDPQAIRLLFLQTGYRKPMNFTEESLAAATAALAKLRKAFRTLAGGAMPGRGGGDFDGIVERVEAALDDDMNTSAALAVLFDAANKAETYAAGGNANAAANALTYALELLRIVPTASWLQERRIDVAVVAARLRERLGEVALLGDDGHGTIAAVVAARDRARKSKDFALADRLRDALAAEQIELHDTHDGTTWTLAGG